MKHRSDRGQALVEFSLAVIPFLLLVMGVLDLGRGVWQMNTTAEAAREIARETSLHEWDTCCDLGTSAQVADVVTAQRAVLPGMDFTASTDVVCVDITDTLKTDAECRPGDFVSVTVRSTFRPGTPLTMVFGVHTFSSTSRVEIP
jgi:Flp pilus assembly protein TadG